MKSTFLGNVASGLYRQYGDGISSLNIVMPNRRSRLFFEEALAREAGKPLWQPHYLSVDDIMGAISGLTAADRIRLIAELYKVWAQYHDEPFERFYFWGEMLLGDFDQIDKYLIDAAALFRNVSDLKNIGDDFDYFDEEQRKAVARFWSAFATESGTSAEKERFHTIWNSLGAVYTTFRERLFSQGMAYTGMIHRRAAEMIKAREAPSDAGSRYVIIGFNALSACEKVLFDHLKSAYGAEFFWDYDDYYKNGKGQEAGLFAKENIARYPQPDYFLNGTDNFCTRKNVTAVSVPSDSLQCKYAATFLQGVLDRQGSVGKETAIVLTNEELLVPLLYSLPEGINDINVTMGYPLRQSLAYSFTERLLKLQSHARRRNGEETFYHADVTGLLAHPFILAAEREAADAIRRDVVARSKIFVSNRQFQGHPFLEKVFSIQESWDGLLDYVIDILSDIASTGLITGANEYETVLQREFFGEIAETLRKLKGSLTGCGVEMAAPTVSVLARRMLQGVRIPYSGEPLRGLQIMGILETRNLDFDNVLILSMNDDNFPGNPSASSSFIPYNLRYGYGLPTPQHHDGVYAYYFYRLLQRAENIHFAYSSTTSDDSSGEPSRYIYQLEYESPHEVSHESIDINVNLSVTAPITVTKTEETAAVMSQWLVSGDRGKYLSPSAFNAYVDCPLKFYFRSVARLEPEDEVTEEIDVAKFGDILHRAMELLYLPLKGITDPRSQIKGLIDDPIVNSVVDRAIGDVCFSGEPFSGDDVAGNLLLVRDIVIRYISRNLLPFDARQRPFTILELEYKLGCGFEFGEHGKNLLVRFGGKADRVDLLEDGSVRIVDYKTGSVHKDFAGIDALMAQDPKKRVPAVAQTLLYSLMADRMQRAGELRGVGVSPALYYVRAMNDRDYSPLLNHEKVGYISDYSAYSEEFEEILRDKLSEMFDLETPFVQCQDPSPCAYCDFDVICRRAGDKG